MQNKDVKNSQRCLIFFLQKVENKIENIVRENVLEWLVTPVYRIWVKTLFLF